MAKEWTAESVAVDERKAARRIVRMTGSIRLSNAAEGVGAHIAMGFLFGTDESTISIEKAISAPEPRKTVNFVAHIDQLFDEYSGLTVNFYQPGRGGLRDFSSTIDSLHINAELDDGTSRELEIDAHGLSLPLALVENVKQKFTYAPKEAGRGGTVDVRAA